MPDVLLLPVVRRTKIITLADTGQNCVGCVGFHNKNETTDGHVKLTYYDGTTGVVAIPKMGTIYINATLAWATGTNIAAADLVVLFA